MSARIRKIGIKDLFVSEPNPAWFGNPGNDAKNSNWSNSNWLKSRFHFSFAEWNGGRGNYGCLRVVNDDLVQPKRGFGKHGHGNMEICTYVLDGSLYHKDSMGTSESLPRGSIQFMTAGTGVQHEERNLSAGKPLRFIQTWILPRSRGLKPNYGSFSADSSVQEERTNKWLHLVGDVKSNTGSSKIQINQDCNLYVAEIDAENTLSFDLLNGRQGYLICVEGSASVNSRTELLRHEACEVTGTGANSLVIQGNAGDEKTHVMLFEMAAN